MNENNNDKIKALSNLETKALRLKYVRHLEKFHKKTIPLLKKDNFEIDLFVKIIDKYYNEIKLVQSIRLDSTYLQMLENFVNLTLNYTSNYVNERDDEYADDEDKDFENKRLALLKHSNLMHKEKNNSIYKKDKHKKRNFTDGY